MAYVITDPCIGTCDAACVSACPVDCISGPIPLPELEAIPAGERHRRLPTIQLYIDPGECICCAACVPACPVAAIFDDHLVPAEYAHAVEANAAFFRAR